MNASAMSQKRKEKEEDVIINDDMKRAAMSPPLAGDSSTTMTEIFDSSPTPSTGGARAAISTSTSTGEASNKIGNDATIADQKKRAIQYWETSKEDHTEALMDQVHHEIMEHLNRGMVLPIFHALCRPPDQRLFPPESRVSVEDENSDQIQLSTEPVTMGECEKQNETVGEVSMEDEESYITAFFTNSSEGYLEVRDGSSQWKFSDRYTKIITNLVNAPAAMAGEDIEVTELLKPLNVDWKSGRRLITRCLSRGVVSDCFAKSEMASTYAIVGNPGIGKSWTLIYALQQALLYENACVLLCFQKDGVAIVCIRRNNKIYVWMDDVHSWGITCRSRLFMNSNVLVLLDPRESKKGGAEFSEGRRMLIMAASNNAKHFGATEKFTSFFARYLSPFTDDELKVAVPLMVDNQESPTFVVEALKRAKEVGNLPRYITSNDKYQSRMIQTRNSISTLEEKEVKAILFADGTAQETYETLHGCIFAVNVSLEPSNSIDGDDHTNESKGSETQLDEYLIDEIEYINDEDNSTSIKNVGYDGQHVPDYGKFSIGIISETVQGRIFELSREYILSFWGVISSGKRSEMGRIVENLFWEDLKNGYKMRVFSMKEKNESFLELGRCKLMDKTLEMNELGQIVFNYQGDDCVIARMNENTALCDFAGPGRKIFQVTVSDKHTISMHGLEELLISSGHLNKCGDTIAESENANHIEKVSLYWVVPPNRLAVWKQKRPKTCQKRKDELLKKCLDYYVEQFVLVMDVVPNK